MDSFLLLRIQFGLAIGLHYLFPVATIGLASQILFFQALGHFKRNDTYSRISAWLTRLFAPLFVCGVATGLLMPFLFGTGWSRFSVFSGEIFGSILAIESTVAFTLESVFLAILLFGKNRVSPRIYLLSAFCVFLGTHLSAFFIVAANSWMQTPAGFAVENGRIVVTSLAEAILNPSTMARFLHVVTAAWIAGTVIVCAMAAAALLRKKAEATVRPMLAAGAIWLFITPIAQLILGHEHIMNVLHHQPVKSAAYEGIFSTIRGAPLYITGIPDANRDTILYGIKIPGLLSLLEAFDPNAEVKGLHEFPRDTWPPVNVIFTTFHLMVGIGFTLIGAGILGLILLVRKRLYTTRWFLRLLPWLVPLPFLANELGWIGTEIGRQPWLIWGVLKTADAFTPAVQPGSVIGSMIVLVAVYSILSAALVIALRRIVSAGPQERGA
ncbi:MAG: cytochrome ubiquinol oxidase subunit I [Chitinispirillaceae bacterium]|nr:cytochrome ubiquinol oxidase subunit I [Chitinispirillaceae bacterium]